MWSQIYGIDIDINFDNALTGLAKILSNQEKNPVRGGYLTGFVGGGNEGKEETSFHFAINLCNYCAI